MSGLILHHYPMSPFSQKIRAMLGYTQLHWQSALTREMPPRPVLAELAGGYRKIPVAQIGADVFCDSRTIAAEIAALSGRPALALENCSEPVQAYVSDVDLKIFLACVMSGATKALGRKAYQSMSLLDLLRFLLDRVGIGMKATVANLGRKQARAVVLKHLAAMEVLLEQDFLFGTQPGHADFSSYHSLWFIRDLGESGMVNDFPRTLAWMNRIRDFGEGNRSEIDAEKTLEIARDSSPRQIAPEHRVDPAIGNKVVIAPTDYAQVPTTGVLVGATPARWIVSREAPSVGTVHVHFPKQGFAMAGA